MSPFDSITGDASARAARNNAAALDITTNRASGAVQGGYDNAFRTLTDGSGPSALSALGTNFGQARTDLGNQYDATQGYLGLIGQAYQPLIASGGRANDARSDALGLNGADGTARATSAFQGSLGYNAGLDTGLDSVMRTASARGNLAGGNTSRDLFDYGADYQNRQAGSYISQLGTAAQNLNTGIAGQATGLGLQGQASQGQGTALGALGTGLGTGEAAVYGQGAQTQANQGSALASLQTGLGNSLVANNNTRAAGENQSSLNALGAILGGARNLFGSAGSSGGVSTLGNGIRDGLGSLVGFNPFGYG